MSEHLFVNFYLYAKQKIFSNLRVDTSFDRDEWKEITRLSKRECGKLTEIILEKYMDKICGLGDSSFLNFFSNVMELEEDCLAVENFLKENKEKLTGIYKDTESSKLFSSFEDISVTLHKKIFENFGDVILSRGDLNEYFVVIDSNVLFDYYKRNKSYFKCLDVEDWLKIPYLEDDLKDILDDYCDSCDFKMLFSSRKWNNYDGVGYIESNFRKRIKAEKIYDINEIDSIYSNEFLNNLEIIKRRLKRKEITKNSDLYKSHFSFFANWLVKNNNIDEINKENIKEIERYFFLVVKGLSLINVKRIDGINKIALYNRVGESYDIDEKQFSLKQIQNFNVKEHKLLLKECWMNNNRDFVETYKTLVLKLMLCVGYERARYILKLDKNISTLEHLVGNVYVKDIELDENGDPILNRKIINLLFKDLERNRIELMIKDKSSELYKYFPRIFNEWDLIEANRKGKNLRMIIDFLKSDDVCVSAKYYRLNGLFKYIGCRSEIVKETLVLHDEILNRGGSTIPKVVGEKDGYTYEILDLKDMYGLTVGNRTDCCFTVKGNAFSSLKHALTNKNGRILVIKKDGELVGHSWLWRNGNVLCLDNIEVAKNINEVDFLDVYLRFSEHVLEKSSYFEGEETCLKNVVVGRTTYDKKVIGLEKYRRFKVGPSNNVFESNVEYISSLPFVEGSNLYSDAKSVQVLLKGNGDFKYYDNVGIYLDERKDVLCYSSCGEEKKKEIFNIINGLRYIKFEKEGKVKDFEVIDLGEYKEAWCNDDWYITIDKFGNEEKYALERSETIKNEMKSVLNNKIKKVVKK